MSLQPPVRGRQPEPLGRSLSPAGCDCTMGEWSPGAGSGEGPDSAAAAARVHQGRLGRGSGRHQSHGAETAGGDQHRLQ